MGCVVEGVVVAVVLGGLVVEGGGLGLPKPRARISLSTNTGSPEKT